MSLGNSYVSGGLVSNTPGNAYASGGLVDTFGDVEPVDQFDNLTELAPKIRSVTSAGHVPRMVPALLPRLKRS